VLSAEAGLSNVYSRAVLQPKADLTSVKAPRQDLAAAQNVVGGIDENPGFCGSARLAGCQLGCLCKQSSAFDDRLQLKLRVIAGGPTALGFARKRMITA
jgi:hypothetical protein